MKNIQVALVGFGLSGRYLQAPFFEAHPEFHLKSVVTSQESLTDIFPQAHRADNLEAVLSDPAIDLVSIASPNETHFAYARACLLAGKHVLVEKPFTATVAEAETLIALAKEQGRHLFVFQNRRFDSDFLTLKKLLDAGELGDLLRYEAHFLRYKPVLNVKKWKEIPAPSNGILYDLGSHLVDQCIALFGAPRAVWGETYTQREGSAIDDAFDLQLDYGRLKVGLFSSLLVREPAPRYILRGTKASFVKYGIDVQEDQLKAGMWPGQEGFAEEPAENAGVLYREIQGRIVAETIPTAPGNWQLLFQNLADVVLRGAKPLIPMTDIVAQLRVMEQVKRV